MKTTFSSYDGLTNPNYCCSFLTVTLQMTLQRTIAVRSQMGNLSKIMCLKPRNFLKLSHCKDEKGKLVELFWQTRKHFSLPLWDYWSAEWNNREPIGSDLLSGVFFVVCMAMLMLSLIKSILVVKLLHHSEKEVKQMSLSACLLDRYGSAGHSLSESALTSIRTLNNIYAPGGRQ